MKFTANTRGILREPVRGDIITDCFDSFNWKHETLPFV